jgi:hypothetical protein
MAALSGVNPFDQWGVELGKAIATSAYQALLGDDASTHPAATQSAGALPHQIDSVSQSIIDWLGRQ